MPTLISRIVPQQIDNQYHGRKTALWLFGFVLSVKAMQMVLVIVNGYSTLGKADGIPLDTYPVAAAQTIVAVSALLASHLSGDLLYWCGRVGSLPAGDSFHVCDAAAELSQPSSDSSLFADREGWRATWIDGQFSSSRDHGGRLCAFNLAEEGGLTGDAANREQARRSTFGASVIHPLAASHTCQGPRGR